MAIIRVVPQADKAKLSGWVRDQNILGDIPELTDNRIRRLAASPIPGIRQRADRLLNYVIRKQKKLGDTFTVIDPALIGVTYSPTDRSCMGRVEAGLLVVWAGSQQRLPNWPILPQAKWHQRHICGLRSRQATRQAREDE